MRAEASLEVVLLGGQTRLAQLDGPPPLVLRPTGTRQGRLRVHLVAGAGGPCQGDDLHLRVRVGPGASLELRSTAATVVLPGRGGGSSRWRTEIDVETGATLVWKPEPTIAAARSNHVADTVVRLAPDATLVLREEVVAGRFGEHPGGTLRLGLRVDRGGHAVYDQEVRVGPEDPLGPGFRAVGTLVVVSPEAGFLRTQRLLGPGLVSGRGGPQGVVAPLAVPGAHAAAALAADTLSVRRMLAIAEALCANRSARTSAMPLHHELHGESGAQGCRGGGVR